MYRLRLLIPLTLCLIQYSVFCQIDDDYSKSLVNFEHYEVLMQEIKGIRKERLISFDQLLKFQKDSKTIILDTRSKDKYEAKHIKGAINLPFTEFTTGNLRAIIPDTDTRIIIYCNNNFEGDEKYFSGKFFTPDMQGKRTMIKGEGMFNPKTITLALNIPTYLGLYGYGYRNIYELDELVNIDDPRLILDGTNGMKLLKFKSLSQLQGR
jgi:hypothetical protein